jgi:hypothetical protein
MFRRLIATAVLALVAGCATAPKEDNALTITIGEDGKMRVVSAGGSPEDQILAALMQSALDGDLDAPEAEPLPEDQVWRADGAGNLTHIQSGAQCQQHWGEYTRTRSSIFKPDGMDVGCNYGASDGRVLTFYVYESDLSLGEELDSTIETIKTRQPVSTEARFGSPPGSPAYVARALAYEAADGTKMRTSVALANGGSWRLKMRLTCEANVATQAENAAGVALMGQADRLESGKPPPSTEKPSPV